MKTEILKVNPDSMDISIFDKAAKIIQNSGLVAFPTETVYGLGANALNADAVKKIYIAKGRPSDNPLIVHIAHKNDLHKIAKCVSKKAEDLIETFWPGALTLIFEKNNLVPYETSGGLDTVAVRCPQNAVAQLFIKHSRVPIAAPSANLSGKPSPTRASHVEYDLAGKIELIIDGGHSEFGLESTILDVSTENPILLRPGSVTKEMIEKIIGKIEVDKSILEKISDEVVAKAPGMKYMHYSPLADVIIYAGDIENVISAINSSAEKSNKKVGILATKQTKDKYKNAKVLVVGDREKPETIAANLFKTLREFDYLGIEQIYSESFTESDIGMAIMNRLKKAAGYKIKQV